MSVSVKTVASILALAFLTLADDCDPLQIRLAYAGPRGMAVSWNTNSKLPEPTVFYGRSESPLDRHASSRISTTYPTSSTYNNHVIIVGLEPATTYFYMPQCGNQTYSFVTAPEVGDKNAFQFAMVGDLGTMGPDGLSTTVGKGAANPLKPGELNTIDSLQAMKSSYKFVWHGLSPSSAEVPLFLLSFTVTDGVHSGRHCLR